MEDLRPFKPRDFANALVGMDQNPEQATGISA
jgi:hypothetical protein